MNIQLQVSTPKPFSLGLDLELAKLKEVQSLLDQLGRTQSMKLDLSVTGADGLLRVKSQVDTIVSQLKAAGEGDWAEKLKANLVGPEQAMAGLKARAAEMRAELHAMRNVLRENQQEWARADHPGYSGQILAHQNLRTDQKGKLEHQRYSIPSGQAASSANVFMQGFNNAQKRIDELAAKLAQVEAAATGAEALTHLGKAAEATVNPMQHAAQQAAQHATAAAHDAKETHAQAQAHEALAKAKKRSAQVTGDGEPGGESGPGEKWYRQSVKRASVQAFREDVKRDGWFEAAMRRATISDAREGIKAQGAFDAAVRRGTLDSAKRSRNAGDDWDAAVRRDSIGRFRQSERERKEAERDSGRAGDWWQAAARRDSINRYKQEQRNRKEEERNAREQGKWMERNEASGVGDTGDSAGVLAARRSAQSTEIGQSRDILAIQRSARRHDEKVKRDAERAAKAAQTSSDSADTLVWRAMESSNATAEKQAAKEASRLKGEKAENDRIQTAAMEENGRLRQRREHEERREAERQRKEQQPPEAKPGLMGRYGEKLGAVGLYTAAAATVYAALGSLKAGFEGAIHTDREMAMMGGIFRGAPGEHKALTRDVLGIASMQGRSSEEAMEAGMKFSHLGLSRAETGQFSSLSMKAANISGVGGAEAAHAVASYTEAFGLGIGGASVALDQMNSVANHTNVTIKDLMESMSRTGAIAKTTGFSLVEMSSLLAGGAGKTGLPLTQFTQAFGMMLTNANDPSRQKELKSRFGLDVFRPTGEMKSGPELAADVNKAYQKMKPEQGLAMLSTFGGARQGQRLAAIFDNYSESIARSIAAQRDLNSAQNQNNAILETTSAKLTGVASAWKLMWHDAHQGGLKSITNGVLGVLPGAMSALDTSVGFVGAMLTGNVGKFVRSDQMETRTRIWNTNIENRKTDAARQRSLADASGSEARMFGDAAGLLEGMAPEAAKNLIGALATAHGGANEQENREEWLHRYATGGVAGMKPLFAEKRKDAKKREAAEKEKADEADESAKHEVELYLASLDRQEAEERARGKKADQGALKNISIERSNAHHELAEMGSHRMRRLFNDLEDQDPASMSAREGLTMGMKAMQNHYQSVPLGSRWEAAKMARENQGLNAEEQFLKRFQSQNPGVSTIVQSQEIAMRRKELAAGQSGAEGRDKITRGMMDANIGLEAFGAGRNHTEQLMDVMKGISQGSQGLELRRGAGGVGGTAPEHAAGEALALSLRLEETKEKVLQRQASIQRELNQLKADENREAARAFAFASRGDQLSAALMRRHYEKNGKMSAEQFQFMSPESRRGIETYNPDAMPNSIGRRGLMMQEQGQIPDALKKIEDLTNSLKPVLDRAGSLNGLQGATPPIRFPQVNVNVDAAEQVAGFLVSTQQMMTELVSMKFESLGAQMSDWIVQMKAGALGGVGADVIGGQ